MKMPIHSLALAGAALLSCTGAALASDVYIGATISGLIAPNVYGRINIGNAPPPPVLYPQPMIIQRSPSMVVGQPLYLHVPPGHAKKWDKHCAAYNACHQPVYFVNVNERGQYVRGPGAQHGEGHGKGHGKHQDKHQDKHHDKDHGKGHGKGHGRD